MHIITDKDEIIPITTQYYGCEANVCLSIRTGSIIFALYWNELNNLAIQP